MIAAHRGGASLRAENSLPAFREAMALGVDAVELDVHLTRDGELAVIHDATLDRTTTGHGAVHAHTWSELGRFVLKGTEGEQIPRLTDVLGLVRASAGQALIEVKVDGRRRRYPGIEAKILGAVRDLGLTDRVIITAFEWDTLERFETLTRSLRLAGVVSTRRARALGGIGRAIERLLGLVKATELAIESSLLSAEAVAHAHAAGLGLGVWTPSSPAALRAVLALVPPADWVITDRPDLALELRARATR